MSRAAYLILENGTVFEGKAFGAKRNYGRTCFYYSNDRLS